MIHLKKFNEDNSDLYTEVSYDKYMEPYGVNLPKNILDLLGIKFNIKVVKVFSSNRVDGSIFNGIEISDINGDINIYYSEDEWFYVEANSKYGQVFYRCDQIDGLKKLLKDKGVE